MLNRSLMRSMWKRPAMVLLAGMIALHCVMFWKWREGMTQGKNDFFLSYISGKMLRMHDAKSLYDRGAQWRVQQQYAPYQVRKGPLPYMRPPFEALLFLPFAYLNYSTASIAWAMLKLCFLFSIPFLLNPCLPGTPLVHPFVEGVLWLGFPPLAFELLQGQDSLVLLLIFTLTLVCLQEGMSFRAGLGLGLGLFKFHFVLPILVIFLLRKKFKVVAGFGVTAVLLGLLSWRLVGWQSLAHYPRYLWSLNQEGGAASIYPLVMPNVRGLLALVVGASPHSAWLRWLPLLATLGGICLATFLWRREDERGAPAVVGFSIAIVVTLFTADYSYIHDLTLLLIPLSFLARSVLSPSSLWDHSSGRTSERSWLAWVLRTDFALLLLSPLFLMFMGWNYCWVGLFLPPLLWGLIHEGRTPTLHPGLHVDAKELPARQLLRYTHPGA